MNLDVAPGEARRAPQRREVTAVHTRILRTTLATDDCYAYWQKVDTTIAPGQRARAAFEARWFGLKSDARVRTLMGDMLERFDAFPESLELLHELRTIPAALRPWICHVHTALADPIYREFVGVFLPERRALGYSSVDREQVARWVRELYPERWSSTTATKFGSNLLATAFEAGLLGERRDPRPLTSVTPPDLVIGYTLYVLRDVVFEGSLTDNPYLRSLGVTAESFRFVASRVPGIRFAELGGAVELTFTEPSIRAWGMAHLRSAA
ncbi:MAG: DUF1819 family protein [Myxococcota bacterium]|nr:DUF1819 family protein [Myxococcota bacterium]